MDSALENDMRKILRALSTLRVPAAPEEYDIHALVSAALERAGIAARHEARLCPGCRIDFLCGHVGIEVKKNRPPRASLMKQIARYAASPDISALILVAPGDLRLPREVCGVPVECVALARLWGVALP